MIEELWRSGELPYVMVGNKRVCEKSDLDAWVDKQKKETGKRPRAGELAPNK